VGVWDACHGYGVLTACQLSSRPHVMKPRPLIDTPPARGFTMASITDSMIVCVTLLWYAFQLRHLQKVVEGIVPVT